MPYADGNEYIVLADIKTDWPDVFGPFTNLREAREVEETLLADSRIEHCEIQAIFHGSDVGRYLSELDEIIEP